MARTSAALLRPSLGANLALSSGCGLGAAVFAPGVAAMFGIGSPWIFSAIGISLLVFAGAIAWTLLRVRIGHVLAVSALDLIWVLGTVPLTLVPGLLTPAGSGLVLALAVIVGALGALQLAGVRGMLRDGAEPGRYRHCIRLESAADPDALWHVIRDLGAISRYSAGLRASRLEGGDVAPGATRVCTDTRGRSWREDVQDLDDATRTVVFRFRSEAEDFPFPLAALSGGWSVAPGPSRGARVDVWWHVTPKQRRFGWVVVALMTIPLDRDLPRIVAAMEAAALGRRAPEAARRPALGYC